MKTLKITDELHRKIKVFCAENNLKINEWVEKELNEVFIKSTYEFDVDKKMKIEYDTVKRSRD